MRLVIYFFFSDEAQNETIDIQLSVYDSDGEFVQEYLYDHISSSETVIGEEVLSHGQMELENISLGSIVLRLKPVTSQAVQNLLNAKENNMLLEMICGLLKKVHVENVMDQASPIKVRIQVIYSDSATNKPGMFQNSMNENSRQTNHSDQSEN